MNENMTPEKSDLHMIQKIIINESLVISNPLECIREEVIKANTFTNPKFGDAKKYGRSVWNIPSHIQTFQLNGNDLIVQRGYSGEFFSFLKDSAIEYEIKDQRCCPKILYPPLNDITLRPYQKRVIEDASKHSQGVLCCPTGSGKSILGVELIRIRKTSALIITHKKELVVQWKKLIEKVFGFSPKIIGDGTWEVDDRITIATVQTLVRYEEKCREIGCGLVLLDECHHAPADQFAKVLNWLPSKFRYGLSATLSRRDRLDDLIFRSLGPVIAFVSKDEVEATKSIVPAVVKVIKTGFNPGIINGWQKYISSLNNAQRNLAIVDLIPKTGPVLILTDRILHAEEISRILTAKEIGHVLAHGNMASRDRTSLIQRIKDSRITVGTTSLLGEGLDVSSWSILILASPISSEAKLLQAIGRIVRPSEEKEVGVVYDLYDESGLSKHSLKSRIKIYEKNDIPVEFEGI